MADQPGVQTASSTPVSLQDDFANGSIMASTTKAPKDRVCPFCHTPYTASSLGRHLDTYIRAKNPKPPDGLHDPDKIRKIREGITRRQMRTGSKREASRSLSRQVANNASARDSDEDMDEDDDDDDEEEEDDDESHGSPTTNAPVQKLNRTETGEKMQWRFNEANWAATGVMNNVPSRPTSAMPDSKRDVSRQQHLKAGFEARQKHSDEEDTGRAAELALREVLERIQDANSKSADRGVFDFDPYQLTFPSLCLKILPPPPTLWSPSPFPTHENWPIIPPGAKQWEALQLKLKERVAAHERASHISSGSPAPSAAQPSPELGRLQNHLNTAYHHWQGISDRQRQEAWQLEILRMFSNAEEGRKSLQSQLELAMRHNEQLRRELEDLRRARDVGEPAPTHSLPHMAPEAIGKLLGDGLDAQQWDYDSLLQKWRNTIKEGRRVTNGMAAQRRLSATPTVTLNNKKLSSRSNFDDIREDALETAAGAAHSGQHTSPNFQISPQNALHPQQQFHTQLAEQEIIHVGQATPIHHPQPQPQVQYTAFPASHAGSSVPTSPQTKPRLTAQSAIRDQRRASAQLSPHSMPSQSRRVSVQHDHISPNPTPQQQPTRPPPLPQEAHMSIMTFNTQPPALQIPQAPISQPPMPIPSPFSTTPIAPPPPHMQAWIPPPPAPTPDQQFAAHAHAMQAQLSHETQRIQQQAQQMSQELMHAQQLQAQMQSQSMPPTPVAPQGPYSSHLGDPYGQAGGLQIPQQHTAIDHRRNSAPMLDVGHHAMMQQGVVETPASAGGYLGMAMGFGAPGMEMMVNGTHAG